MWIQTMLNILASISSGRYNSDILVENSTQNVCSIFNKLPSQIVLILENRKLIQNYLEDLC